MSKKEVFGNMIKYSVRKSLQEAYNMPTPYMTPTQEKLVDLISDKMYALFGNLMTVKDLQEKVDEVSKTL